MTARNLVLLPTLAMLASGCAYSASGQSYPRYDTRTLYDVEYGEVVSTREVTIEGDPSLIGVWGGAEIGRSVGNTGVSRAIGGVAGAVAGAAIERKVTAQEGLEITVRLENDRTIAVVQAADVGFEAGQRVRVLIGPFDEARVSPL